MTNVSTVPIKAISVAQIVRTGRLRFGTQQTSAETSYILMDISTNTGSVETGWRETLRKGPGRAD